MTQDFVQTGAPKGELDIEGLKAKGVSFTWIYKFKEINAAGLQGFNYGIVKTERPLQFLTRFNLLAFFFSWIYYIIKGMWKKASLFFTTLTVIYILTGFLSEISISLGFFSFLIAWVGLCIYLGLAASGDYYRHSVLKEDFWI